MTASVRPLGPATDPAAHALRLLDAILESSEDAIMSATLDGTIVSWNRAAERMYGYLAEEMIGQPAYVMAPPELRPEVETMLARVSRGERVDRFQTTRIRKDGRTMRVTLTVSPLRDEGGEITGAVAIARDVTEEVHAEDRYRASEDRYRVLFEQHPVPMWVYEPKTLRFVSVNEAAILHYGYSRQEFASLTVMDIRPEEDRGKLEAAMDQGAETDGWWRHRRKNGTVFDVQIISREITMNGAIARLVIAIDVTERAQAERELRRAYETEHEAVQRLRAIDEMKNTFLNAVSHELRTPLAAVVGSATTLKNLGVDLTNDDQREMVQAIAANALRLQRMLSDLLDLDRLTRGVLRPRLVASEIGDLVRRVIEDSEFLHDRPVEVEAGQMVFPIDPPKVERILENLLTNAIKYSPEGTPIWVRVDRVPEGAQITVEDVGPGIPEELRTSVFEPFQQGPNAPAHAPGVGIGLSLVAKFAELHKGRAWWEERPGGGSRFCVLLREPTATGN